MNETIISVRGEFSAHYPAERATVRADVSSDGPDRQTVFDSATAAAASVAALTTALHNTTDGPITEWSSDAVSVWSDRPWNAEGAQLPLVFHSRIGVTAQFSDFSALARWIEGALAIDGVGVTAVDWSLTAGKTTTVTAEVRSRAVKDAVAKASIYAQSIGLGSVRAIAIADPGMLGEQGSAGVPDLMRASATRMKMDGAELSFRPQDIEVSAAVDARFLAS